MNSKEDKKSEAAAETPADQTPAYYHTFWGSMGTHLHKSRVIDALLPEEIPESLRAELQAHAEEEQPLSGQ